MVKLKNFLFVFLSCFLTASTQNNQSDQAERRVDGYLTPPQGIQHHKTQLEEPSFFSKFASWLFPFGGGSDDSVVAETQPRHTPQYLPPHQGYEQKEVCNPCNSEPWIPVAGHHGQNTIIGFVQQPSLNHGYGHPESPLEHFRPPSHDQHAYSSNNQPTYNLRPGNYKSPVRYYMPSGLKPRQHSKNRPTHHKNAEPYKFVEPKRPQPKYKYQQPNAAGISKQPQFYGDSHNAPSNKLNFIPPQQVLSLEMQPPQFKYNFIPFPLYQTHGNLNQPSINYYPNIGALPISNGDQNHLINSGSNINPQQTRNFDHIPQDGSKVEIKANNVQNIHNVEVLPSIRIADYLASIEHPINVIQSPIVEVITRDEIPTEQIIDFGTTTMKLNENPIIVSDDVDAAATAQNASFINSGQNNVFLESSNLFGYQGTDIPNPVAVTNAQIHAQGNLDLPFNTLHHEENSNNNLGQISQFTQLPPIDYSIRNNDKEILNPIVVPHAQIQPPASLAKASEDEKQNPAQNSDWGKISGFTQPSVDYSNNWAGNYGSLSPTMGPPPVGEPLWLAIEPTQQQQQQQEITTAKPKHVQIIIPYISNNSPSLSGENRVSKVRQTNDQESSLPLFTQPPSKDTVWDQYVLSESQQVTSVALKENNIRDLLVKETNDKGIKQKLPFDIVKLQQNIDDWTEQEFANTVFSVQNITTSGKYVPSKKIPSEYLTTQPYAKITTEFTTEKNTPEIAFDHEHAGSSKITQIKDSHEINNFIVTESLSSTELPKPTTITQAPKVQTANIKHSLETLRKFLPNIAPKSMWERLQISVSNSTKEKVYVVTPQPWKFTPKEINEKLFASFAQTPAIPIPPSKFSVVIQPEGSKRNKQLNNGDLHIVYSEWPHLINKLLTTTTDKQINTNLPILDLDLVSYTPPPNSSVETYSGHSKVVTVVTSPSVVQRENSGPEKNKT